MIRIYTTRDLRSLVSRLELLDTDLRRTTNKVTEDTANHTERLARMYAPKASGALARSIHVTPLRRGVWEVSAGDGLMRPYARAQEEGYTPHVVPRAVLHPPEGGNPARSGFVRVSGYTPYMRPALREGAVYLDSRLRPELYSSIRRHIR